MDYECGRYVYKTVSEMKKAARMVDRLRWNPLICVPRSRDRKTM